MIQYLDLLKNILENGTARGDRTGTGTKGLFGAQLRFDLSKGFPLVTTRKVFFKGVIYELLWFLAGDTNIKYLTDHNVHIWDSWADENGDLGPVYGAQWRDWRAPDNQHIDQITQVIEQIRTNPNSRRHIVSAWNPAVLPDERVSPQANVKAGRAALASCHTLFQFYVADGRLSCQLYQRSADSPVGLVFNIAQYSLLTHMVAQQCDLEPGDFIWTGGDCHIYVNQFDGVKEQLSREPRPLPKLIIKRKPASILEYQFEDFEMVDYNPHPPIKFAVAV
ncbi:MAG TPA: thymidylate synthase [Candidatus Acidoferrum sp.]|jgi:thymidylate synthase|nr:thymidylate synthase [Candidatus Acidoferrum sp.]